MWRPTLVDAPTRGLKSGMWASSTGVGTATMMMSASASIAGSSVYTAWRASASWASSSSREGSVPRRQASTLAVAMSKPMVRICLPNSTTRGRPT